MKIVSIFADQLFSFHYDNELDNEWDRLMDLWTDLDYLHNYAKANNIAEIDSFVNDILNNSEQIQDILEEIYQNSASFKLYFQPLKQSEEKAKFLSLQKGKLRNNQLRIYAIKISEDCFIITGGAIKMSQKMQDHPDTNNELEKLMEARRYLKSNDVFDDDSFFELLTE